MVGGERSAGESGALLSAPLSTLSDGCCTPFVVMPRACMPFTPFAAVVVVVDEWTGKASVVADMRGCIM